VEAGAGATLPLPRNVPKAPETALIPEESRP